MKNYEMLISDFRSSLDQMIGEHESKAAQYGSVRETHASVSGDMVYLLSLLGDGETSPSEFHTALRIRGGEMELYYEYPI